MTRRTPSLPRFAADGSCRALVLGTRSWRLRGWNLLGARLVSIALLLGAPASDAFAQVRIGLTGDSIVEGAGVTSPEGLRAALGARLRQLGYPTVGWGYVPAHGSALQLDADGAVSAAPWRYYGGWTFVGLPPFFDPASPIAHRVRSRFGADGHATESASPLARATTRISGDRFAVLFVRAPDAGRFRVSVDGRDQIVEAFAPVEDGGGITWIAPPRRTRTKHEITIVPVDGKLRLTGILSERAARASRPRVNVLSLGQSCACASDRFPQPVRQALATLELDLTVILFGTNDQAKLQASNDAKTRRAVVAGLRARAEIARRSGGRCLIVPPAPNGRPAKIQRDIRTLERRAAAQAGCRYAPVLARLWNGTTSIADGLTLDGIHPTPAGYERMARALAEAIRTRPPLAAHGERRLR